MQSVTNLFFLFFVFFYPNCLKKKERKKNEQIGPNVHFV